MTQTIKLKLDQVKGWFWFCPIHYNKKTEELGPRFKLWPLFDLAMFLHHSMIFVASVIGIDIDEVYPIKITKTGLIVSEDGK